MWVVKTGGPTVGAALGVAAAGAAGCRVAFGGGAGAPVWLIKSARKAKRGGGGMEELVPVVWARGGMGMRCPVVLDVKPWFGTFISEFI